MKKYFVFTFVLIFISISLFAENDPKVKITWLENSIGIAPFSQVGIRHEEPVTFSRQETAYGNDLFASNWYSFDTGAMVATTIAPVDYECFSGDYGIQGFFAIDFNTDNLLQIEPDTGAETIIGNMPCPLAPPDGIWAELCCDKTTGNWYAIASDNIVNSQLYSVDITNAGINWVADLISTAIVSGAVDQNGILYTLDLLTDSIYETDLSTYTTTLLGLAGFNATYIQGAAYEPIDDIFYFAAFSTGPELRTLDRTTGATTYVGALPGLTCAFGFPGSLAEPEAPGAPTDFVVIPDAGGALEATISWTCPTTQVNGEPLTDLDEMRVYRDDVLIYTDTSPVIGGPGMYVDSAVSASGLYTYKAVGFNDFGEGILASGTIWVGEDVPNVVENLLLVDQGGNGYLTWTNPTTGLNGGAFNNPILGYHIERNDGVFFEVTGIQTDYLDTTIPTPDYYYYTVTPYNLIGNGGSETSNTEWIGDAFGIVIVDLDPTPTGATLQASIENFYGGSVVVTNDINAYPLTSDVEAVFLLVGVYSNNYTLQEADVLPITNYLDGGGKLYMEGADTWAYDTATSLHGYFNILPVSDGSNDLSTVNGDDFLAGMTWFYSGENYYIDHIDPIAPAFIIFSNPTVGYNCGVAYDSGTYNTVGTSFEITGLGGTNTLDDAIEGILAFFDIGEYGDVAGVITDNVTTNPIEGVEVYVGNYGPAFTNALGEYFLQDVITGIRDVSAFKDDYYDFFGQVEVLANQVVTYDFTMEPLQFATLLAGNVTDVDTGLPIEDAEIYLLSELGYEYWATTNASGDYSIVDIVSDTYDITCTATMYIPQTVQDIVFDPGASIIQDFAMEISIYYFSDFEDNDGYLLSSDPTGWAWGEPTSGPGVAYSGTNVWATVLGGNYVDNANWTLETTIPVGIVTTAYMLEFWHWYDIEASYDGGNVKVSADGGTNWTVIIPLTGYPGTANTFNPLSGEPIFCGHDQGFWELVEFDLSAYVGENILVRWHFGSDGGVVYPGWYIDDVRICEQAFGSLEGFVLEFGTGSPIADAEITIGLGSGTSGLEGDYFIDGIVAGTYDVECEHEYYLPALVEDVVIEAGVTTTLDISMLWSEIAVDVTELVSNLAPDETEVQTFIITNDGPGELEYNISFEYPTEISVRQAYNTQKSQNSRSTSNVTKNSNKYKNNKFTNQLEIKKLDNSVRDESPFVTQLPVDLIREMWNLQFSFDATAASGAAGNAGVEFDGTYFYSTRWASSLIHKYDIDGNLVLEFSIPGVTGLRDLAYDGTHFYGGTAGNTIYEMDFETQTLIGTIYSSVGVRAIAYDSDNDAFYVSNWDDPVGLIARDGTTISTFNCGLSGTYGFAYDNVTGGQYLWIYDQGAGAASPQYIHQFDLTTNMLTGISHDTTLEFPDPDGIAGGLFLTTDYEPIIVTIGGLQQGVPDQIFCYELAPYSTWVAVTNNIYATVAPNGGFIEVEVTFDATDLTIGEILTADLLIHNNSNYVSTRGDDYFIPVTLNVISVGTEEDPPVLYTKLGGNYPNPFNPETAIKFANKEAGKVRIDVFNIKGQYVKTLVNDHLEAKYHTVIWDGKDDSGANVSSGVYFYKMDAGKYTSTKKMILMK